MGSNSYTTQTLLDHITLTGHVPTGNATFNPQNLITLADRELATPLLKQILSARGNYYLTSQTQAPNSLGLYDIPSDCVMGALYFIQLVQNVTLIPVNPLEISEQFSTNTPNATSYGYYFVGNQVQILPTPTVGNVKFWYFKRPSQLVLVEDSCQITAVDPTNSAVTVSSIPESIFVGSIVDVVGDQPPFNILGTATITNIALNVITLDVYPTVLPVVGNFICLYQQTCVPPIPVEYRILLEQRVICSIYEIQKNKDGLAMAEKKLEKLEKDTLGMITNRVGSNSCVISVQNGGFLSGRSNRGTFYQTGRDT